MLYIVVTPIGNLGDITYRAVETLKSADLILCEDTRHSAVLFARYGITAPVRAYEKFSESRQADAIADMIESGKNVALVSDAGTPATPRFCSHVSARARRAWCARSPSCTRTS